MDKPNYSRVKHTILYTINECQVGLNGLTITKLYKVLYFIDFGHYALYGKSVTNIDYLKFKYGPVPMGLREYLELLEDEDLIDKRKTFNEVGPQTVFEIKGEYRFNEEYFSKDEISTITKTVDHFCNHYAKFASNESHYHYSWINTGNGFIIPLNSAKFCDFEWLGYYRDKSKAEFEEVKDTRQKFISSSRLKGLMEQIQSA